MLPIICPRVGAGVAAQAGNAARAACSASLTSSRVESGNSPRQSASNAGLVEVKVAPSLAEVNWPLMILYPRTAGLPFGFSIEINSNPVSKT